MIRRLTTLLISKLRAGEEFGGGGHGVGLVTGEAVLAV